MNEQAPQILRGKMRRAFEPYRRGEVVTTDPKGGRGSTFVDPVRFAWFRENEYLQAVEVMGADGEWSGVQGEPEVGANVGAVADPRPNASTDAGNGDEGVEGADNG